MLRLSLLKGTSRRRLHLLGSCLVLEFAVLAISTSALAQLPGDRTINDRLRYTPQIMPSSPAQPQVSSLPGAEPTPPLLESPINADYLGRAALLGDDTRLAGFANGNFLPSAIPVAGQPFFGSPSRANLQGNGSAVGVSAAGLVQPGVTVSGYAQLLVQNASLSSTGSSPNNNVTLRQAFGQINRLSIGSMETAFADPASAPETLDLAGPNARITVAPAGLGGGQGRLSYYLFSDGSQGGFRGTMSLEQPLPQIQTVATTGTFASTPDFVTAWQYVDGDMIGTDFLERWHLQFASVFRSLGLENDTNTFRQTVFGWGTVLSGSYRFVANRNLQSLDRVMFSVAYGQGISHYVTDLNNAADTNDAVVNSANVLVPLPVLAWYVGYTHNWTDAVRSTATFSQVNLDSVVPLGATTSPYRLGDYVAANLVYHRTISATVGGTTSDHNFYTGLEYLFGHKETLDGAVGDAQRIMWVTSISN
jgi:hypothetical protein